MASRIPYGLHEAFPELRGQELTDITRLEVVFGSARDEALCVLANWELIKNHNPQWLREWLPAALEHVLGQDVTAELLAGEGSWLAEL